MQSTSDSGDSQKKRKTEQNRTQEIKEYIIARKLMIRRMDEFRYGKMSFNLCARLYQ